MAIQNGYPRPGGNASHLNIAAATVVKGSPGTVFTVSVTVAGSAPGAVYDSISTSGNTVAKEIFVIPNTVGVYTLTFPAMVGIVIAPGTGQTVSVAYA